MLAVEGYCIRLKLHEAIAVARYARRVHMYHTNTFLFCPCLPMACLLFCQELIQHCPTPHNTPCPIPKARLQMYTFRPQSLVASRTACLPASVALLCCRMTVAPGAKGAMANTKVSSEPSHSRSGLRLTVHTFLTLFFCTH